MPELPEVETIKRGLEKSIVGKTISDFDCDWHKMVNYKIADYRLRIKGLKVICLRRRAKMLIVDLSRSWHILIHLKMTGQLVYGSKVKCLVGGHPIKQGFECLPNKFTHATFTFTDKSHLYFNDIRKFGWLRLYDTEELLEQLDKLQLGPEPLDSEFTLEYLKSAMSKRPNNKIKQFLMDNKIVVGVGNIYSDEVCFFARVRPDRRIKTLADKEIKLIYQGIKKILIASIKAQGTTFSNYRNANGEAGAYSKQLKVYGRYGEKCKVCGTIIKKMTIGGRTSSYCHKDQK